MLPLLILVLLAVIALLSIALWRTRCDCAKNSYAKKLLRLVEVAFETGEAMFITDLNGAIQRINLAFTWLTGYTDDEVIGQNPSLLRSGRHDPEFYAALWNDLLTKGRWAGESRCRPVSRPGK
jgi:PAS domain S-box-containing protein